MNSSLQFEISDLRQQNIQRLLETVGVILAAFIIASLLPNILLQYVYTDQAALMTGTPPFWLQNGSMVILGFGVLYFLYSAIMVFSGSRKIAVLKQQLSMVGASATFSPKELAAQEKELAELEKMVDEALETDKKSTKKSSTRSKKAKK